MLNVLIVDDEPIIRVGLRTLVDWEEHGLKLYGEASDGEEALEMIRAGDIDILVTDIRMPKMDGLDLIREAAQITDDLGVMVLSCLDDFSYVKEAMKLGAKDYILKPTMEPDEFVAILQSIGSKLKEERSARMQISQWQAELEQTRHFQLSKRIHNVLENASDDAALEEELFSRDVGLYSLMVQCAPSLRKGLDETHLNDCMASIRWSDTSILLLFPCEMRLSKLDQHKECFSKARELAQLLDTELLRGSSEYMICIGPVMQRLADLKQRIPFHLRQFQHGYYASVKEQIVWDEYPEAVSDPSLPYEQRNDLLKAIASNNSAAIFYQAELIGNILKQSRPNIVKLHAFIFELFGLAVGYAREQGYADLEQYEQHYVSMEKIQSNFHIDDLNQWIRHAIQELWAYRWGSSASSKSNNPFIRKALQYMKENYHKNIGAADIAAHVKLSRSYLSDLYSKEMGDSLIETLTRIRIEEAKKRLGSGEKKVYEVAVEVGFSDSKSFAKTFKRMVGCSPKEYDMQNK